MSEVRKEPVPGRTGGDLAETKQHQNEVSKGQLQDQLADFLFQSTEESFDEEALNALLDALDEADPLPDGLLPDTEESLARFHERYAPVFESVNTARAGSAAPAGKTHSKFAKILPFAAILIFLFGTITAQAFGVNVLAMFSHWTSEVFRLDGGSDSGAVIRKNPLAEGERASYDTLEEAVAAFGIDVPLVPKEIPERFGLQEVFAENWSNGLIICAEYLSEDGAFQIRYRENDVDIAASLEKEKGNVVAHPVEGVTHFLLTDLGREKAIWKSGDLECRIFGNVSRAELKGMIDSIYEE